MSTVDIRIDFDELGAEVGAPSLLGDDCDINSWRALLAWMEAQP